MKRTTAGVLIFSTRIEEAKMSENTPRSCPFCGAKAYPNMRATSGRPVHIITCAICTANVWASSREAALRIWNRRADERKSAEAEKATYIQTGDD